MSALNGPFNADELSIDIAHRVDLGLQVEGTTDFLSMLHPRASAVHRFERALQEVLSSWPKATAHHNIRVYLLTGGTRS